MRVAFIHFWLITWRGGEKVLESLLRLFPDADIYTLFYDHQHAERFLGHRIFPSSLNNRFFRRHFQKVYPLYPLGIRSLRLRHPYDLIISSESGPAKGIANPLGIPHLCYIHTPMRYCWGYTQDYLNVVPAVLRPIAKMSFDALRRWDLTTVDNVDRYVANSRNVRDRVRRFYNRDAAVVHAPISLELFRPENLVKIPTKGRKYYLSFGAITPYKNIELLIETFNRNGKQLIVIGDGSERRKLERRAKANIHFLGNLPWAEIRKHILDAKALLFPGEEDFGMVPLEVMAHGVPVIALARGGALETVIEIPGNPAKSTGLFFAEPSFLSLQSAIDAFESYQDDFDPVQIQTHARQFGEDVFLERMQKEIRILLKGY